MATKFFRGALGGASAVAQIDWATPANVEIGDQFSILALNEDGTTSATITFTATVATVANVTAGLAAAWNASTDARASLVTAADATTKITLTADTAGIPFFISTSATDGGGANTQTLTRAASIANKGSGDWGTAANWSDGAVPVTGDTVYLDGRAANAITYGLNQSGVTLAALYHYRSMNAAVGTVTHALKISATILQIGLDPTDGSNSSGSLFNINTGTNATTAEVYGSPSTGSSGLAPCLVNGAHASNAITIYSGIVGIGTHVPGASGNFPTVNIANGTVTIAAGVTVTNLNAINGRTFCYGAVSGTATITGGDLYRDGTVGTLTSKGGNIIDRGRGGTQVTTFNWDGGNIDFTADAAAVTYGATAEKRCGTAKLFAAGQWTRGTKSDDDTNGQSKTVIVGNG